MLLLLSWADETLNTEAVANVVLKTTKGWYGAFADSMGIPWTIQERIKNDFSTVDKQKRALMKYWVETLHDAAWTTLAGVLYQTEENSALSDALKYLKEDRGIYLCFSVLNTPPCACILLAVACELYTLLYMSFHTRQAYVTFIA